MAVTDVDGIIYYRYVYDTYGELSDITTDDGVSLKSSEQLTEYQLAELAHATGIDYLYNGQYGVETDSNGLYYMRARYYDQDIKRFINRDVVSGDIGNSQSLNRYCYVQGNPVSLTDPFGLCPDPNSNFKNFCKFLYYTDWSAIGHAALDVAGLFWDGADVINALWYALERNPEMAIASAIFAIPGAGIGIGNLMMKSEKLASAGKAVRAVSKFTQSAIGVGAGMSIATVGYQNLRHSIEAGEFSLTDLATFIGGLTIAAISGKGLISSGKDFASLFDDVGKTSKAGKGYLTDADVNSMPIGGNQAKVSSLSPGSSRAVTGASGNIGEVRFRKGKAIQPMEVTYDMRLNPEAHAYAVAEKYGINLRGSGQKITIKYDDSLGMGIYGKSGENYPTVIVLGKSAFCDEATLANTIAHELSHCRDFLRGAGRSNPQLHKLHGDVDSLNIPGGERTVYGAGNALEAYIRGER